MYGIVMATHGDFASGLYNGFKLICGAQDNIRTVDFVEGDSIEVLDEKLQKAYNELKHYESIIFLTDLAGGSPFTRSVMLFADKENVRVLSGLSFPLLYMATLADKSNLDDAVEYILNEAKAATVVYCESDKKQDDTDGI